MTTTSALEHSVHRRIHWPLALGLGAFALIRPGGRMLADQLDITTSAILPVALTVLVTAVWVAVAAWSRTARPVATLVLAGVSYAVLVMVFSAVLSPILDGRLQGPLANPASIVPLLLINAGWGAIAGLVALAVQRRRY